MRRYAIYSLLAALSVLALAAGPANAARGMKVGIEDEDIFVNGRASVSATQGYRDLADLNIHNMRVLITQSSVQQGGGFNFSAYQNTIRRARDNGVAVQVVLVGKYPRPNVRSYAKFAAAAAQALKGTVTFYSIWNEPNLKAWIRSNSRAAIYRRLYTVGYKAIKKNDPSGKVLIGETAPFISRSPGTAPLKFLRQVACVDDNYRKIRGKRCPALKSNGYAHHPYDLDRSPRRSDRGADSATIGTLSNLTRALSKLRRQIKGTRNIYLTEFGYAGSGPHKLSETTRAAYLRQAFAIAYRTPRMRELVQYLLAQPKNSNDVFPTGVLSSNGQQLPSYAALKASVR